MADNHGMEEDWGPHHERISKKNMIVPIRNENENGVKGSNVIDILASPGRNGHEGQVTFDRHQETDPQMEQEGFNSLRRFLGFEEANTQQSIETSGRNRYKYQSLESKYSFSGSEIL